MGETKVLELPVMGGLDQKTAQEYLDPTQRLATVTNGNFTKIGLVDKRLGITNLPSGVTAGPLSAPTSGTRLTSWSRSSLTMMSAANGLYNYAPAEQGYTGISPLPPARVVRRPIVTNPTPLNPTICDVPYNAGTLRLAVYPDQEFNVWATVIDANTQDVVLEPTLIYTATGAIPAVPIVQQVMYLPNAPFAQQVAIVLWDINNTNLLGISYNRLTNTFTAPVLMATGLGFNVFDPCMDVVPFFNDPAGGMIVFSTPDGLSARWYYYGPNFVVISSGLVETLGGGYLATPFYCYATSGASEQIWFNYQVFVGGKILVYQEKVACVKGDGTFAAVLAPTLLNESPNQYFGAGIVRQSASTAFVAYWQAQNPGGVSGIKAPQGQWGTVNTAGVAVDTGVYPLGMLPINRPYLQSGSIYQQAALVLYLQSSTKPSATHSQQGTLYLLQLQPASAGAANRLLPVATVAPRQVDIGTAEIFTTSVELQHLTMMSGTDPLGGSTRVATGFKVIATNISAVSGALGGAWIVDYFADTASQALLYQSAEIGSRLGVASGVAMVCDGAGVYEDSFFYYPEFAYCGAPAAGGLTGTYQYAVCYAYTDSAGLLARSSPTFTAQVVLALQGVQVHIPPLSVTWRNGANPGQVYAEVYRTASGGSTFYLVDRIPVGNLTTDDVVWPTGVGDNTTDAQIQVSSILYTTGGILDNVIPPSANLQCVNASRTVIVDDTLRQTWESKAFTPGEAPGYNEALITSYPEGGDITAIASLDDKLVVFKSSSIWVRYGDGPADTGQGSDWTVPRRVASDVGAVDWRGVVLMPQGLMFQASNGLYLLGRDLQVTFIGKAVQDLTAAYPTVLSSTLVASATQVRFLCQNLTGQQIAVVYDYLLNQWTTHTYPWIDAGSVSITTSSAQTGRTYSILDSTGKVWQEMTPGPAFGYPYMDRDGLGQLHFVPTNLTFGWVKLQGLQAYQRARRAMLLAEQADACGLTISYAVNLDGTIVDTGTIPSTELPGPMMQIEKRVGALYNKQSAIQFSVSDVAPVAGGTTGQGAKFTNLSIELDVIGPRYRQVPAGVRT